jgi:hypothetical protein
MAPAGRGWGKLETDSHHVLKTTGEHLEHHLRHGQRDLSAFLRRLNLLALLFHTVLEWSDAKYALLRQVLARRPSFFQAIEA